MGEKTNIGWCHHTFNIAWGCIKVSPGCENCYAKAFSERIGYGGKNGTKPALWGPAKTTPRRTFGPSHWAEPLKWDRAAAAAGERRRVFSSSMADIFEDHPTIDAERAKLWPLIRSTPHLDWLLLTKRPERIAANLPADWGQGYPNVWLGTSVESQDYVDRIEELLAVPAIVHWLSIEPLLGPVSLIQQRDRDFLAGWRRDGGTSVRTNRVSWLVVGGESGPGHRTMDLDAAKNIFAAARWAGVPIYVKQDSGPRPEQQGRIPDWMWVHEFPTIITTAQ